MDIPLEDIHLSFYFSNSERFLLYRRDSSIAGKQDTVPNQKPELATIKENTIDIKSDRYVQIS